MYPGPKPDRLWDGCRQNRAVGREVDPEVEPLLGQLVTAAASNKPAATGV